jgi:hypothetical protein
MDGEWELAAGELIRPVSVADVGWNVYQFKTVDILTLGAQKALSALCRSVRGTVAEVSARQTNLKTLARYILFTNLRLGLQSQARTAGGRRLNTLRDKVRTEILKGAPANVEVTIIDAEQIAGFVARHPALRMGWFAPGQGTGWDEMRERTRRLNSVNVPLIGREKELADLQGWLGDPDVRVIAVSGPNSVGKTRLVIDATEATAPVTFFADDVHALLRYGVAAFATADRAVVLVAEDPPVDIAKRLAEQAVGCDKPIKLIITLPSPEHAPVIRLSHNSAVKPHRIPRLPNDAAIRLVEAVDSGLEHRLRDWIVQQAGGIPGVLVEAAALGEELHRESGSLRKQLSQKLTQSLEAKAGRDALVLIQVLAPLAYVRVGGESPDLKVLLAHIAPEVQEVTVVRRLGEFEALGFVRKHGEYVAVVPPMFAAGVFHDTASDNPLLPQQLMASLDLAGRKRLLERLVTVELSHRTPFTSFVFGTQGPFGDTSRFTENLELLDYLARAVPEETARFLRPRVAELWRDVVHRGQTGMERLLSALNELVDEPATAVSGFSTLTELATREALETNGTAAADQFTECFVYWYPRCISYEEREAAVEAMLAASEPALNKLGLKAIVTATTPPDTLSGRSVSTRRLGSKRRYGTWNDCWAFIMRMIRKRIAICVTGERELSAIALNEMPNAISRLCRHLRLEDSIQVVREISAPYFDETVALNGLELRENVKWLREFYGREREQSEEPQWREKVDCVIAELDRLLERLKTGSFTHRLKFATARTFEYDDAVFEGRKLVQYQVPLIELAREAARDPEVMTDAAWELLCDREALNAGDFAVFLGESDSEHHHFAALLARAGDWQGARLLGFYLSGATTTAAEWVETTLDDMLKSPAASKSALLTALRTIGPTEANRSRLKHLLSNRSVSADDVAMAFSSGRWLDGLPADEVKAVLTFILSEPGHEPAMVKVTSLYLHHHRPVPRELFDTLIPILTASADSRMQATYELDQIATGIAIEDLEAGFVLLRAAVKRLSDVRSRGWWTGWNPFESYGTRDFWEYLRKQEPERAYGILGEWNTTAPSPRLQDHSQRYLLDLSLHRDLLVGIARADRNAAYVFSQCVQSSQPGFFAFAYELVAAYASDRGVIDGLNSALIPTSGFGYEYDWLTTANDTVTAELKTDGLSHSAKSWLESLQEFILRRQSESRRGFDASEPPFVD